MLVVIANYLPPAVQGRMKLWFIEPRANVFVSGIKDSVAQKVVAYFYKHCPQERGLMVFRSLSGVPGYEIYGIGETKRALTELSGLQLIIEQRLEN